MFSAMRPATPGFERPGTMMANSSPLSLANIWFSSSTARDSLRDGLKHRVAGRVSEQIVDLLEPVEIEAQDREPSTGGQGRFDLLVELLVESAPIGKPSEGVVMREEADMLFGLLARLQIANRNGAVRFSAVVDRTQDQFDRCSGAVGMQQFALDWLVRPLEQLQARAFVGKELFELCAHHGSPRSDPIRTAKLSLTVVMDSPSQTRSPSTAALARPRIRSTSSSPRRRSRISMATPARARTMMMKLASATAIASQPDGSADGRNLNRRIGDDRGRTHRGEMVAADRQGQQQRAEDSSISRHRCAIRPATRRHRSVRPGQLTRPPRSGPTRSVPESRTPPCRCNALRRCRRRRWRRRARRPPASSPSRQPPGPRPVRTIAAINEKMVSTIL